MTIDNALVELIRQLRDFSTDSPYEERLTREAADALAIAQKRVSELEAKAQALVAKLDECEPHITGAFLHLNIHGGNYAGPNYADELKQLRASLQSNRVSKGDGGDVA